MANRFKCANCGKEETVHTEGGDTSHERGYHYSLAECPGFSLSQKDRRFIERQEEENFRMAIFEREARSRAAWGAYSATVRQNNLDEKLEGAGSQKERERILKKAKEENLRGFYIG